SGQGNLISGNNADTYSDGVWIVGSTAAPEMNNLIEGNFIGPDVTGTKAIGNVQSGIHVYGQNPGLVIGGTVAGTGNLISSNGEGVIVEGPASGIVIEGNKIGTDVTGMAALPNTGPGNSYVGAGDGILIRNGAFNNTIGGTAPGAGNLISGNA